MSATAIARQSWDLRRNCALRPGQLLAAVGAVCGLHLLMAGAAWSAGLAWVAAFALLESGGIAVALLCYMRHACDRETIVLEDGRWLCVERHCGNDVAAVRLEAARVRVGCGGRAADAGLVQLSAGAVEVQVGRHVRPHQRQRVAQELRHALRRVRALP